MVSHGRQPIHYRGSDVIDPEQRLIGKIDDLVYGDDGQPIWAVVELGLMRSAHYLPVAAGYLTENGKFVVPFDKRTVKAAPRVRRDHVLDRNVEAELIQHYELAEDELP
ncbi:MAG TPA: hypothetical protein VLN74_15835 [Ilumatobacteraceae bacterium]|nr:hypothetical protein [Ilumatobacteraceae bacterium]